jgi:hypothetical protein
MRYLIQVRFDGAGRVIRHLPADEQAKITAEFEAIRLLPGVLEANRLAAAETATTVRVDGAEPRLSAGPAVAAGAELDGYYVYDAADLETAIAFAARVPVARMGGSVEVRALRER